MDSDTSTFEIDMNMFTQRGFDELDHAAHISAKQAQLVRDLKHAREANENIHHGGFTSKDVCDRIFWAKPGYIEQFEAGQTPLAEDLFAYVIAAGLDIDIQVTPHLPETETWQSEDGAESSFEQDFHNSEFDNLRDNAEQEEYA